MNELTTTCRSDIPPALKRIDSLLRRSSRRDSADCTRLSARSRPAKRGLTCLLENPIPRQRRKSSSPRAAVSHASQKPFCIVTNQLPSPRQAMRDEQHFWRNRTSFDFPCRQLFLPPPFDDTIARSLALLMESLHPLLQFRFGYRSRGGIDCATKCRRRLFPCWRGENGRG